MPEGIDEAVVRRHLLTYEGLDIGAGLGPMAGKIWRIGLMGQGAHRENVLTCVSALDGALAAAGASLRRGDAVTATDSRQMRENAPAAAFDAG